MISTPADFVMKLVGVFYELVGYLMYSIANNAFQMKLKCIVAGIFSDNVFEIETKGVYLRIQADNTYEMNLKGILPLFQALDEPAAYLYKLNIPTTPLK